MKNLLFLGASAIFIASPALSKAGSSSLKWMAAPAGLPSGAQIAVVSGDPGKKGDFTVHLKFPANYAVAAHHHPTDEHIRVLSGKLLFGMGDKADRKKAKWMTAGATGTAKAGMNHFVFTDGPAELELKAMGPFQITYANPHDDPRKAK